MASPNFAADVDSRTSSAGTKRRFNVVTSASDVVTIDSSSEEDESFHKPQKRMRLNVNDNVEIQAGLGNNVSQQNFSQELAVQPATLAPDAPQNSSRGHITAEQDLVVQNLALVEGTSEPTSRRLVERTPREDGPNSSSVFTEPRPFIPSGRSWNKRIKGELRTSFGNRVGLTQHQTAMIVSSPVIDIDAPVDHSPPDLEPCDTPTSFEDANSTRPSKKATQYSGKRNCMARAKEIAKDDNGRTRERLLKAGRVLHKGTRSRPRLTDFVIPSLTSDGEERIPLDSVRFKENFMPLFVAVNMEKIPSMRRKITIQAFESLLDLDYSDAQPDQATKKVRDAQSLDVGSVLNAAIKAVTGKGRPQSHPDSSLSKAIIQTNAAEDEDTSNGRVEVHVEFKNETKNETKKARQDAAVFALEIAKDIVDKRESPARAIYEAKLSTLAGRVFTDGNAESGFIDFIIPILLSRDGERMNLDSVRFLVHFLPLFIALNIEKVSRMNLTTAARCFEVFVHMDYKEHPASRINEAVRNAKSYKKESNFDQVKRSVTLRDTNSGRDANRLISQQHHMRGSAADSLTLLPEVNSAGQLPADNQLAATIIQGDSAPSRSTDECDVPKAHVEYTPIGIEAQFSRSMEKSNGSESAIPMSNSAVANASFTAQMSEASKANKIEPIPTKDGTVGTSQLANLAMSISSLRSADQLTVAPIAIHDIISLSLPQSKGKQTVDHGVSLSNDSNKESGNEYGVNELSLMQRYYPGSATRSFVPHCLTCAETGHKTSQCPQLECSLCGASGIHFTSGCQLSQRCTKCRELGHLKGQCQEKLNAISGGPSCTLCNSMTHFELDCEFLWRSFRPDSVATLRVRDIPHSCYYCGSDKHFSPDCGVRPPADRLSGSSTWSWANWDRNVSHESDRRAPSAGKDYNIPRKKELSIKGRASDPINLDSDDEDDALPFLGRQVARASRPEPQGKQAIRFYQSSLSNVARSSGQNERDMQTAHRKTFGSYDSSDLSYAADGRVDSRDVRRITSDKPEDDSARHEHERTFSPPPAYPHHDGDFQPPLPPGPPPSEQLRLPPFRPNFVSGLIPPASQPEPHAGSKNTNKRKKKNKKGNPGNAGNQLNAPNPKGRENNKNGPTSNHTNPSSLKGKKRGRKPKRDSNGIINRKA